MINGGTEKPDLILATGDLVHEPTAEGYNKLLGVLQSAAAPVFCLPGNHDRPAMMDEMLNTDSIQTCKSVRCGEWEFILLDSVLEGEEN